MLRLRAIWCCLYFSIVPWWVYEKYRHYQSSYLRHLRLNLETAWLWLTFRESPTWVDFEKEVNPDWITVLSNMTRFTNGSLVTDYAKQQVKKKS